MEDFVESVLSVAAGLNSRQCRRPVRSIVEDILRDIADLDSSGSLSTSEMRWLSDIIFTKLKVETDSSEGTDASVSSKVPELEVGHRLAVFTSIENRLRAACSGDSFVFPSEVLGKLPEHWRALEGGGIDSRAGCFFSSELDFKIIYDIGVGVRELTLDKTEESDDWRGDGEYRGTYFQYARSDGYFIVSFPGEVTAKYIARPKNLEEAEYVLELVVKYRRKLHAKVVHTKAGSANQCEFLDKS